MVDSTTLTLEGTELCTLRLARVRLSSTLQAYRLTFDLELVFFATTSIRVSELRLPGEVLVRRSEMSASPRVVGDLRMGRFGTIIPPTQLPARPSENPTTDLTRTGVEALEDLRVGGGLTFILQLYPLVIVGGEPLALPFAELAVDINHASWATLLEQVGYRKTMLFELPLPATELRPELTAALEHLERAQHHYLRADYREAVGSCRDALEGLTHALGDEGHLASLVAKDLPDLPKGDRLSLVRRSLLRLSHLARHGDPLASSTSWTREDARAVLGMTAALLGLERPSP
jgi:hypothetical protein